MQRARMLSEVDRVVGVFLSGFGGVAVDVGRVLPLAGAQQSVNAAKSLEKYVKF